MEYHVILIECGKPTHRWVYPDAHQASLQLDRLNVSYEEVNEVFATLVKVGPYERDHSCRDVLQNMLAPME